MPDTAYALGFPLMVVAECHAPLPMLPSVLLQLPRWAHAQLTGPPRAETRSSSRGGAMQGRPLGLMGLYACPQATTQDSGAALTPRVLCCSRRDAAVLQSLPSSPRGTRHWQRGQVRAEGQWAVPQVLNLKYSETQCTESKWRQRGMLKISG